MLLYEFGIPAVAPNSENQFVTESQLEKIKSKFKTILVFYDNDLAGIQGMCRIKKIHPELNMKQKIFQIFIKNMVNKKLKN